METVSDQMLRHTGMAQAERRYFNEHFRQDIERSMADIFEHIQDHLRSFSKELGLKTFSDEGDILGGATLDRLRQNILKNLDDYFKREIRQSTSPGLRRSCSSSLITPSVRPRLCALSSNPIRRCRRQRPSILWQRPPCSHGQA